MRAYCKPEIHFPNNNDVVTVPSLFRTLQHTSRQTFSQTARQTSTHTHTHTHACTRTYLYTGKRGYIRQQVRVTTDANKLAAEYY